MNTKIEPNNIINAKTQHNQMDVFDEDIYAIIVHGLVPEFMPHLAFRRDKHYKTAGKKEIKCPFCRETLTVVEVTAKLELIRYPKRIKDKVSWHKSMPCDKCNNVIGIIYKAS